jgi:hypothetical protein
VTTGAMKYLLPAACVCAVACGASAPAEEAVQPVDTGPCFIAFSDRFDGFRSWLSAKYDVEMMGPEANHINGPRIEYINAKPPHGQKTFPVGTIIVKEMGLTDPENYHLFAMVKRGCGYNASGALGWEWMELREVGRGVAILWRGVGPPGTGTSSYLGSTTCNMCHAEDCYDNDAVCSAQFRLATF